MKAYKKLKRLNVKLLILDVDGVLTDGKVYISDTGYETKCFNTQDGLGLKLLLNNNIDIAVISGRESNATRVRMRELGIKHVYLGVADKIKIFDKLKKKLRIKNENIVYVGDDLPDLSIIQQAGFGIAVANAVQKVRKIADYVTTATGGNGAVREVCDIILNSKC